MGPSSCAATLVMLVGIATGLRASSVPAAGVPPRTTAAYDAYVADVERAFLVRAREPCGGADQSPDGRIVKVHRGLVHHWRATTHIPGVTLDRVIATAQRYDAYRDIYASVVESRVLQRDEGRFRVLTRVQERVGGVTVVLEVESVIRYVRATTSAYSIGASARISEVLDAGQADERVLASGPASGYLWRANTFTRFVEGAGGVDVELETIGLSRRFPPLLAWLIEPFARRLGRRSVERTLSEFAVAVRAGVPSTQLPTGAR
jgi:hypothetical protein